MEQQNDSKLQEQRESISQPVAARPNEVGSLQIDGFVRIFDPNTQEVYVEKRA